MSRYIEEKDIIDGIRNNLDAGDYIYWFGDTVEDAVAEFPTADVAPIVHGSWEVHRFIPENSNGGVTYTRCSICGNLPMLNPYSKEEELTNYCPNCGARMDGEI